MTYSIIGQISGAIGDQLIAENYDQVQAKMWLALKRKDLMRLGFTVERIENGISIVNPATGNAETYTMEEDA